MRILGIAGSLRRGSHNRKLLRAAAYALPPEWELVEWRGLKDLPAFDEDLESGDVPTSVQELRDAIADADAVLIATPEYNASVPGALKNALDWASRPHGLSPLAGKPVAVISSSPSPFGATWAGESLRRALSLSGAQVVDGELAIGKVSELFENGELADSAARARIGRLVEELAETVAATEVSAVAA